MDKSNITSKEIENYYKMVVRMPNDTRVRIFAITDARDVILEFSIDEIIDKIEKFKCDYETERYEYINNLINKRED